jgi:hypothetical protein
LRRTKFCANCSSFFPDNIKDGSGAQRVAAIRLTLTRQPVRRAWRRASDGVRRNTHDEELGMVRNFTTALVAALVLGSAGIASARAPSTGHYDGWTYPQSEEPYCYLPSWPCEQPHRVTK